MKKSGTRRKQSQAEQRRPMEIQMPLRLVDVFGAIEERFFRVVRGSRAAGTEHHDGGGPRADLRAEVAPEP